MGKARGTSAMSRPSGRSRGGARADETPADDPPLPGPGAAAPPAEARESRELAGGTGGPDLDRSIARLRDAAERFREEVLRAGVVSIADAPEARAQANVRLVRSVLGKWSIELLVVLGAVSSARFRDLRRALPGISSDVLSRKRQALEASGLVERRVGDGRPPPVTYRLTPEGLMLTRLEEPILLLLRLWGSRSTPAPEPRRPPHEAAGTSRAR